MVNVLYHLATTFISPVDMRGHGKHTTVDKVDKHQKKRGQSGQNKGGKRALLVKEIDQGGKRALPGGKRALPGW